MLIEQRKKLLKKLAGSSEGKALGEYLQEQIDKLLDPRTYSADDFEIEGKTSIKAAGALEQIKRDLLMLSKPVEEQANNQYV